MKKAELAEILDALSGAEALEILRALAGRDPAVASEVRAFSERMLPTVDSGDVATAMQSELQSLAVEDVWDASGESRHGYSDPMDVAYEMFEAVVREYRDEVDRYWQRSRSRDARSYCLGILKGLYDYDGASPTPFKDYVDDAPGLLFDEVLDDWSRMDGSGALQDELREFIADHCPGWMRRADRTRR